MKTIPKMSGYTGGAWAFCFSVHVTTDELDPLNKMLNRGAREVPFIKVKGHKLSDTVTRCDGVVYDISHDYILGVREYFDANQMEYTASRVKFNEGVIL